MPELQSEGNKSLIYEDGVFDYNPLIIEYVSPSVVNFPTTYTPGDTITFAGGGFNLFTNPQVTITTNYGKTVLKLIAITDRYIKVVIPNNIYNAVIKVQLETGSTNLLLGDLKLGNPVINQISYNKNIPSQPIVIYGNLFHPTNSHVYLKNTTIKNLPELIALDIISRSTKEIRCKYPKILSDTYQLVVRNELGFYYNEMYLSNSVNLECISAYKNFLTYLK